MENTKYIDEILEITETFKKDFTTIEKRNLIGRVLSKYKDELKKDIIEFISIN